MWQESKVTSCFYGTLCLDIHRSRMQGTELEVMMSGQIAAHRENYTFVLSDLV